MADPVLTTAATVTCPHGGQGTITPAQTAASAGAPVCTTSDQVVIAGCPFTVGPNPSPCVSVTWQSSSAHATAVRTAILTIASVGLCVNPANVPQGPAVLAPGQARAGAT